MADQRQDRSEELTPDLCIDFAAGLLDEEGRADVLRLASASPEAEELLRSVMAQAQTARSSAAGRTTGPVPARDSSGPGLVERIRSSLDSLFGSGRLVPAMAGASLLLLGLILGAATVRLLQTDGAETGAPARLISLFPAAARTAGSAAGIVPGTGLYVELNGIDYSCETPLTFNLDGPSGRTVLRGRLLCQPETGEWAGLFLPAPLLAEGGDYLLRLKPESGTVDSGGQPLEYRFTIR